MMNRLATDDWHTLRGLLEKLQSAAGAMTALTYAIERQLVKQEQAKMQIHYSLPDDDDAGTTAMELPGDWSVHRPIEQDQIAEECAAHFLRELAGQEATWPIVIALHESEDGQEIARFRVEVTSEPVFHATAIASDDAEPETEDESYA